MTHTLPPLPYAMDALLPHITPETLEFHYGKHHQAYVTNLNNLIPGTEYEHLDLEATISKAHGESNGAIFNNSAQVWNHTFYWNCMKPTAAASQEPKGQLLEKINEAFDDVEKFKAEFKQAALTQFGSGWAWLVQKEDGTLAITKTGNADLPMTQGHTALLTCDVWEHAYYIDYRNKRPDYVTTFLDHLVNWDFVASKLA